MLVVGELINSTRKAIAQALEQRDQAYLQDLARRQVEAGALIIDVNAAIGGNEADRMKWLVEIVQEAVGVPLCIDSPSAAAIEAGLAVCREKAMLNSITAEDYRWNELLPVVQKYKPRVIALCMGDGPMPETTLDRLREAEKLVPGLVAAGIPIEDIYLDPLIKPLGVNTKHAMEALESTRALRLEYPGVHIICGLSNVSFGLPERRLLNRAFMVMAISSGMDALIMDPLDHPTMSFLAAARALVGQDEYCLEYIAGVRSGRVKA
ncbi:MAG: methyltetrahydrofolate cobalamin methyltransferase [Syntrophomonadaceae bacterium]|nr:methyltetrahydrofolate cobalamin methyltransferase [Syntrophomonadaceae bacterium]